MRSLEWTVYIRIDALWEEEIWTHTHAWREDHVRMGRHREKTSISQVERPGADPASRPWEEPSPPAWWTQTSSLRTVRNYMSAVQVSQPTVLHYGSTSRLITLVKRICVSFRAPAHRESKRMDQGSVVLCLHVHSHHFIYSSQQASG